MKPSIAIFDPLGIEIFAIDETFESVFNGLRGVYFRLYYKESLRPGDLRNSNLEQSFFYRYKELRDLKKKYPYNDWALKRKAVNKYGIELKKMLALELSEYRTIKISDH